MSTINLTVSARDVREGDLLVNGDKVTRATHSLGTTYLWTEARNTNRPCDVIYNHGDPVRIRREKTTTSDVEEAISNEDLVNTLIQAVHKASGATSNEQRLKFLDERRLVKAEILRRMS